VCLVNNQGDSAGFVLANVVALSFSNLLNVVFARKLVILTFRGIDIRKHFSSVISFSATRMASSVYTLLDTVMLSILANMYYVGLYAIAIKLVRVLVALINSASSVLFSRISAIENDHALYRSALNEAYCGFLIVIFPIFVVLLIFGPEILISFAGERYHESIPAMQVLTILVIISIVTSFIGVQVLYVNGEERSVAVSLFYGAAICIFMNILLVPKFHHVGAAMSTALAESSILIYQIYVCFKKKISLGFMLSKNAMKIYFAFIVLIVSSSFVEIAIENFSDVLLRLVLACFFINMIWLAELLILREKTVVLLVGRMHEYLK